MTFFYDMNKKLQQVLDAPKSVNQKLNEGAVAEAGYSAKAARAGKDIGKPGKNFSKIAKGAAERYGSKAAGERVAGAVLNKLRHPKEDVEENLGAIVKKVGGAAKKVGGAVLNKLGHGSDQEMLANLQDKMYPTLKKAGTQKPKPVAPMAKEEAGGVPMTPKQKKFAKLAPPADKITFADKIVGAKKEVDEVLGQVAADAMKKAVSGHGTNKAKPTDEGWDEMMADVKKRRGAMKTGEKIKGHKGEIEKTSTGIKHTRSYDEKTGETDSDDGEGQPQKRGRGRPKSAGGPRQERATAKSRKTDRTAHGQSGFKKSKKGGEKELDEKAVSKAQQKFMGMVHATQKGEKAPSKEVAKVAKTMKKKDAEDFASTKHKGLPEKVKSKKKEKTEEAGGTETPTASSGFSFGQGIYDSYNREVEAMISESMNISMNMSNNPEGGPSKSLTVTATDEDAIYLGKLLKMAGVGGDNAGGCGCGTEPCSCGSEEVVDENSPDWPTNQETSDDALQYSGGVNGPKSTGQTVGAPFNRQNARQGAGQLIGDKTTNGVLENDELGDIKNLAGIKEAAKPDYIDLDKDGNKKETMKKAADDKAKSEKKVEESLNNLWKTYKG